MCSQVTMDCQEKPESSTQKRQEKKGDREREREGKNEGEEGLISYLRIWQEKKFEKK